MIPDEIDVPHAVVRVLEEAGIEFVFGMPGGDTGRIFDALKFLTPDVAVAHVKWGMRGDRDPDGTPRQPRHGVMMQVLMKRDGKWAVVAAQNTNVR